jgi:HemK-related putative methylase
VSKYEKLDFNASRIRNLRLLLDDSCYGIALGVPLESIRNLSKKTKTLIQLFCLHKKILAAEFTNIFGMKSLDDIVKLHVFRRKGDIIQSNYKIMTTHNYYILHDYEEDNKKLDYAYCGDDSLMLANNLPFNFKAQNTLDLCTGAGIQAILLSKNSRNVTGVEVSPEAAYVARFNTILNNVSHNVKIVQGNLYEPVKNKKFDLIVSNPPYIPIPDNLRYPLAAKGGENGLLVLTNIFAGFNNHLAKNGMGLILGITFGGSRHPFSLDLLREIALRDKFDIDVLVLNRTIAHAEIAQRAISLAKFNPKFDAKTEMARIYTKAKAKYLYSYLIKIRRGNSNLTLTTLYPQENTNKGLSEDTSLNDLYAQFVEAFALKQYDEAVRLGTQIERFRTIFQIEFKKDTHALMGFAYEKLNKYKDAIEELEKAKKPNPKNVHIHFSLFRCYRNTGEIEKADAEFNNGMLKLKKPK